MADDAGNQVTSTIHAEGNTTTYTYDDNINLHTGADPKDNASHLQQLPVSPSSPQRSRPSVWDCSVATCHAAGMQNERAGVLGSWSIDPVVNRAAPVNARQLEILKWIP